MDNILLTDEEMLKLYGSVKGNENLLFGHKVRQAQLKKLVEWLGSKEVLQENPNDCYLQLHIIHWQALKKEAGIK